MTWPEHDQRRRAALVTLVIGALLLSSLAAGERRGVGLSGPTEVTAYRVPINTASAAELQLLPGIGPALADRIVVARADFPMRDEADLKRIKGIGEKTVRKMMPFIRFD